jgi:dual specificity phosphatase 12
MPPHLRCGKCRRALCDVQHIVEHTPGPGAAAFDRHRAGPAARAAGACAHYFVEPMAWMDGVHDPGALEGRLQCPRCAAKLGAYAWAGVRCSCGAWVAPAFMLHRRAVDWMAGGGPRAPLELS